MRMDIVSWACVLDLALSLLAAPAYLINKGTTQQRKQGPRRWNERYEWAPA